MKLWEAIKHVQEGGTVYILDDYGEKIKIWGLSGFEIQQELRPDGWQIHQETKELTWQEIEEAIKASLSIEIIEFGKSNDKIATIPRFSTVKQKLGFK